MNGTVTGEQVRQLSGTAKPYSRLAPQWWSLERYKAGADSTKREHQRRRVSPRADRVITILRPVGSDTFAGAVWMNVPPGRASEILADDPYVRAGTMHCEVHPCHGFSGDALAAGTTP